MSKATIIRPKAESTSELRIPDMQPPEPFALVIFGTRGDLAKRKLLPALYALWNSHFLPRSFAIVGVGQQEMNDEAFRGEVRTAIETFGKDLLVPSDGWKDFLENVFYQRANVTAADDVRGLARRLEQVASERSLTGNSLYYLAVRPDLIAPAVESLSAAGLARREVERPWARVVIEKPFGRDLASAMELDRHLTRFLQPEQIYRIDHYLGKETVQNLLAFRFGNAIFEPLFKREYVDHVQITVAESIGMEGRRGAYYDRAGALRDVVQNHVLQLLALVAMEPPATLKACDLSDAKLKVLRNLHPLRGTDVANRVVRGQYGPGTVADQPVRGYRQEEAVDPNSNTESYVAIRTEVENWRWAGVPFLLRTGKRMPRRATEIAVQFKLPPLRLFRTVECEGDVCDLTDARPTVLAFRIQPDEGISLSFSAKRPGMQLDLEPVHFEFDYGKPFRQAQAYERLLLDALRGDATLFMRTDELEAAWEFVTPILEGWANAPPPEFPNYEAGTWGPAEADRLAEGCPGGWRHP